MTTKTLSYNQLSISEKDVYEVMGYHDTWPDEATQQETRAIIDDVQSWLRPQFCFLVCQELPAFNIGRIIERQLKGSEAYALFICTSGVEFEAYQQRLKQNRRATWCASLLPTR